MGLRTTSLKHCIKKRHGPDWDGGTLATHLLICISHLCSTACPATRLRQGRRTRVTFLYSNLSLVRTTSLKHCISGDMTSPGRRAEARGNSWARGGFRRQEAVGEDRKCWICFREQEDHCTPLGHSRALSFPTLL
jgi:hypothetical protein